MAFSTMDLFKSILLVMMFYSICITGITYALPDDAKVFIDPFSDVGQSIDLESISSEVQSSIQSQTNIPVIELGALVFYSGNIIIDLLLNFAFAIPEMIGLLINGIMLLFNIDSYLFAIAQIFSSVVVTVFYFIAIIQLLTGIRSGRLVA